MYKLCRLSTVVRTSPVTLQLLNNPGIEAFVKFAHRPGRIRIGLVSWRQELETLQEVSFVILENLIFPLSLTNFPPMVEHCKPG